MLNFFYKKKRKLTLVAPVKGRVLDITATPDQVFSSSMLGDGVVFEPAEGLVVAPCDGEIILVSSTCHAIALRSRTGVEILIHVGLDTVELDGQGFTLHVEQGDQVKCGDKLLVFDMEYIQRRGKVLATPMVITNGADKVEKIIKNLTSDAENVMEVCVK